MAVFIIYLPYQVKRNLSKTSLVAVSPRLHHHIHSTAQFALITLQKGNVLAWKHILLHGQYDISSENTRDEFGLADPKIVAIIHTRFWEAQMAA